MEHEAKKSTRQAGPARDPKSRAISHEQQGAQHTASYQPIDSSDDKLSLV